jgi:hypothetical protein
MAHPTYNTVIAELRLDSEIAVPADSLPLAARDPFSGSPGFAIGYPAGPDSTPTWPLMRIGFLGAPRAEPGMLALGITVPEGLRGAAVFDATGALAGLVTGDGHSGYRIALPSRLREFAAPVATLQGLAARPRMAPDEIYERAMPRVVQVLVAP